MSPVPAIRPVPQEVMRRSVACDAPPNHSGGPPGVTGAGPHLLFASPNGGATFHQRVQGTSSGSEVQAACPVVVVAGPGSEAEMQPPGAGDPVQGRRGFGEQRGVGVQRGQEHAGDQPDVSGGPGCRGQRDQGLRGGPGQAVAGDQRGESPLLGPLRPRHHGASLDSRDVSGQPYPYLHCLLLDSGPDVVSSHRC